jgi:hypothetical protein
MIENNFELQEETLTSYRQAEKVADSMRAELFDLSNKIARAIDRKNDKALNYDLSTILDGVEQSLAELRDFLKA